MRGPIVNCLAGGHPVFDDGFGERDPRFMPPHFFHECLRMEYESAVKADVSRQNFTTCPRFWYVDATLRCERCRKPFSFSNFEQKTWYEDYGFYVDSSPNHCKECRGELRLLKALRQEYDREIVRTLASADCDLKIRIAGVIDRLCEFKVDLQAKVHENRKILAKQIARRTRLKETETS